MSKLQELINKLCPDGVVFKPLGDYIEIYTGEQFNKRDMNTEGSYPVINGGINPSGYIEQYNEHDNTITISQGGASAGYVAWQTTCFWAGAHCYVVKPIDSEILNKFTYYFLKNQESFLQQMQHGAGIPALNRDKVKNLEFPILPIEVQEEIVRILDRFADYAAELQAELQARKEQYEYYRNILLTFNPSAYGLATDGEQDVTTPPPASYKIEWKTMGEIGKVKMCKRILKNQTSTIGEVPFYKIGTFGDKPDSFISRDLYSEYKSKYPYPTIGTVLISAAGTIGRCVIFDGKDSYFQDSNIVWLENDESIVLNKYLFHYYKIVDWETAGGTIKRLYNDRFYSTPIPVPPLEIQEKIVSILDRFEALVNDLNGGLPAEIAAEKERYEYYRNRLLTFNSID